MKINSVKVENKFRKLTINRIFFKNLTLLVGASGVGKTQIIRSILSIKKIADGGSINGFNWEIDFETIDGGKYIWQGGFQVRQGFYEEFVDIDDDDVKKNRPCIDFEKVTLNGSEIIDRNQSEIIYKGKPTVKLSPHQSVIYLLKEEDSISSIFKAFNKIIFSDQTSSVSEPFQLSLFNVAKLEKKYKSLKEIQNSDQDIRTKLYLAYKNAPDTFKKISERFSEVFPQVENIKISSIKNESTDLPDYLEDYPFIQIKEIGIKDWIHQGRISSGMFRSLLHISEMYLSAEGTVIIIDEFENSLGINCINELTSDLTSGRSSLIQFIITSHHPYIINNIDIDNWKIVTRSAGTINTFDAKQLNLGKSKHDAFIQLINLEEYSSGINID